MKLRRHFTLHGLVIARFRPQCYQKLDSDKVYGFKHDGRTRGGYVGGVRCRGSSRFRRGHDETRQKGGQKCVFFLFFLLRKTYTPRRKPHEHPSTATHGPLKSSLDTVLLRRSRRRRSRCVRSSVGMRRTGGFRWHHYVRTQGKVPTFFLVDVDFSAPCPSRTIIGGAGRQNRERSDDRWT